MWVTHSRFLFTEIAVCREKRHSLEKYINSIGTFILALSTHLTLGQYLLSLSLCFLIFKVWISITTPQGCSHWRIQWDYSKAPNMVIHCVGIWHILNKQNFSLSSKSVPSELSILWFRNWLMGIQVLSQRQVICWRPTPITSVIAVP